MNREPLLWQKPTDDSLGGFSGCLGTLGPGATNLITGVADGNMDRAPMLVLTGQGASTRLHKESHQIMDVVAMYRPVTKWAQTDSSSRQHSRSSPQGRENCIG